jgi:hypothetical protein
MRWNAIQCVIAAISLCATPGVLAQTPGNRPIQPEFQKKTGKTMHAVGNFDVKITPVTDDKSGDPAIGRMLIDKQFHGALEATSKGEMLASMSGVKGSAGYVAMERVQGTLDGRSGTFVLQHTGTMKRGEPGLSVTVVPDSGTGELTGLTGSMKIDIVDGKHFYEFDYALEEKH